ncbi:MAG: DUF4446 family protein [Candidatus Pacebacteria bacterium]|nr:DUF4446 family protein [Candidatus Paceibacterota bacterium]
MSTNVVILFGVAFALILVILLFVVRIEIRLKKLFKGSKAHTLESLMQELVEKVQNLQNESAVHNANISNIVERLTKQGHSVKLLRFNPFPDVGGNQSFAVAIINENGDGVVFSSLYSRERMSVFAKPVVKGTSDIELSDEEKTVVADAQKEASKK